MSLVIKDAIQANLKARIGLIAPAKGGKTFTMLTFLFGMKELGMATKIGVIDTEHRSASKYKRDFGPFRVIEMEDDFNPEQYIEALRLLAEDGCDAVGIDSLSHAWAGKGGALEMKDRVSRQRGFNDYTAWGPVTAVHIRMIEAMLSYPGHLIATMRSKMEYVMEEDPITKKNVVRKIGLQPLQRDGMEFEFDIIGDINQEHELVIAGTRCRALDGYRKTKPGPEVIKTLKAWLESDEAVEVKARPTPAPETVAMKPAPPPAPSPTPALVDATSSTTEPAASPSTDPVPAILAEIAAASTQPDLDAIVPRVKDLPEAPRAVLRARWLERQAQIRAAA